MENTSNYAFIFSLVWFSLIRLKHWKYKLYERTWHDGNGGSVSIRGGLKRAWSHEKCQLLGREIFQLLLVSTNTNTICCDWFSKIKQSTWKLTTQYYHTPSIRYTYHRISLDRCSPAGRAGWSSWAAAATDRPLWGRSCAGDEDAGALACNLNIEYR